MPTKPALPDLGLLIIRAWIGFIGVFHGSQKIFGAFGGKGIHAFAEGLEKMNVPMPLAGAWAAATAEFGGGILIILGLFARIAALPLMFTMLVAFFVAHKGIFAVQRGGGEYPLTIAVILLALVIAGPGRYAITRKW
jgi:putative oxidoreductase